MENAKLKMNKKGSNIYGIVMTILIGVGMFSLLYLFAYSNATDANVMIDPVANESYNKLQTDVNQLDTLSSQMRNDLNNTQEPETSVFGFMGLRGVLTIVKAPLVLLNVMYDIVSVGFSVFNFVPSVILTYAKILAGIVVIFAILAFLTGRQKEP